MNVSTVLSRFVALSMVLVFTMAATSSSTAQFINELLDGRINNVTSGDVFACGKGDQPCNLFTRLWPDAAPAEINGPSAPVSGWPLWRERPKRYRGKLQITGNYPTGAFSPCEVWYSVWTGALEPDTGGFTTYYGAQSQIVGFVESGNTNSTDCQPGGTSGLACFGALDETFAGPSSPPGATSFDPHIPPISGLTPVPVVSGDYLAATDSFSITWPAVAPGNTVNLPGIFEGLCPDRCSGPPIV